MAGAGASAPAAGSTANSGNVTAPNDRDGHHYLTPEQSTVMFKDKLKDIDVMLENYRDALMSRGVPDGDWLADFILKTKFAMTRQAAYEVDVASGHAADSEFSANEYAYPDITALSNGTFYDNLAESFKEHCLRDTNPNWGSREYGWKNNCQRCVVAYEAMRRGMVVETYPSTFGDSHLSHCPWDAWVNPDVKLGGINPSSSISANMSLWGDGARAQVAFLYNGNPPKDGHTVVAEMENGQLVFKDPQTGESMGPLEMFDDVDLSTVKFWRIDNLEMTDYKKVCFKEDDRWYHTSQDVLQRLNTLRQR